MQIQKKNPRTLPLRRMASDASRYNGGIIPGRFSRRFYFGMALLVVYSTCLILHFSVGRGFTKLLAEEQAIIRRPSGYISQQLQLELLDQPKVVSNQENTNGNKSLVVVPELSESVENDTVEILEENEFENDETNNDKAQSSTKPRLLLHVGPQKTGSSSIQSMLDNLSQLKGSLEADNLDYRHIAPQTGDFDCEMDRYGGWHECVASDQLKSLISTAKNEGKNLLLTDENLNRNFVKGLRDAIDDEDWDVTVVVMYRRIHEWLVSWYNQIQKTTNLDSDGNILFDKDGLPYRTEHEKWPDRGGIHVPSFPSWYRDYTQYWEPTEFASKHRSIEFYNLYKEYFKNVILYNMHQEGSMMEDFVCNIVKATHACESVKEYENKTTTVNGSVNLDHDIISVSAYEMGLLSKSGKRKEVVEAVSSHIRETGKNLPRNCDAVITHQIRDWLVDTEKIMVETDANTNTADWSDTIEADLMESYDSFVKKGKICNVDVEAVLADEEWIRFFQSLYYKKGNLVLHVGPIGGTDIHHALTTLPGIKRALQDDNYNVVEIDESMTDLDCTTPTECEASEKFKSMLSSLEGTGQNVLIANDDIDERFAEAFKNAVEGSKWNVKIVVGYIRLNESLLAMYGHLYNPEALAAESSNNIELYSKWPDQGGTPIPTFYEWVNSLTGDSKNMQSMEELLGGHLRDAYTSSFEDVDYEAYHPRQDVQITNFVCKILPGATNTCNRAKWEHSSAALKTEKDSLSTAEADSLAVRAHEMGLVGREVSRDNLRTAIHTKILTNTQKELSRICSGDTTKKFYDRMIETEKGMMGDRFTSKRIAWINQEFQLLLASGKLCALDIEKELSDDFWVRFFRNTYPKARL